MAKKYKQALQNNQFIRSKPLVQHQDIKSKLTILPELEELIPPLKENEYERLENNILKDGCREALLVWEQESDDGGVYILIDGHNRYSICQRHKLDFRINLLSFDNLKEVKEYMINNQLGRRNLTKEQTSFLRGMRYHNEKNERGKYDRDHKPQNDDNESLRTSERLAEEYKVSKNTIERDAEFALGLEKIGSSNTTLKREILSGNIKVAKAKIQQLSKVEKPININEPSDIDKALGIPEKSQGVTTNDDKVNSGNAQKSIQKITKLLSRLQSGEMDKSIVEKLLKEANVLYQSM